MDLARLGGAWMALTLTLLLLPLGLSASSQPNGWVPVQAMRFAVYPDTPSAMEALEAGEVDLVYARMDDYGELKLLAPSSEGVMVPARLWAIDLPPADCAEYDVSGRLLSGPWPNPFSDPEVRRALADLILARFVEDWSKPAWAGVPGVALFNWENETWRVNRLPVPLESPWWNLTAGTAGLAEWATTAPIAREALSRLREALGGDAESRGLELVDGRWAYNGTPIAVEVCVNENSLQKRPNEQELPGSRWPWHVAVVDPLQRGFELAERVRGLLEDLGFEVLPGRCRVNWPDGGCFHLEEPPTLRIVVDPVDVAWLTSPVYTWHPLLFQHWANMMYDQAPFGLNYTRIWEPILALQEGVGLDGEPCSS
ncbi:MAG: hypothetical protein QI223_07065, partial [Candidatus Korarchaeota archaeon]|nr:hypothetical protein [Candidatus Korarchaeota archaeon]